MGSSPPHRNCCGPGVTANARRALTRKVPAFTALTPFGAGDSFHAVPRSRNRHTLALAFGYFSNDIGIDLGTANTLVYVKDKGIVLREPSVVALDTVSRKVRAVGDEAKRMLGRTPGNITAIRPMKDGVIADFDVTEAMLRYFIRKVSNTSFRAPPRVVIAIPSGITEVEKRAVKDSALHAGARDVITIPEPMAAAIGVGLPIDEPAANMIVDIGGGTTEIAIISLNGIVFSKSIRVAGDELDAADHQLHEAGLQSAHRRAHRGRDQDARRLGLPARRGAHHGGQGPRFRRRPAQDDPHHLPGNPRGAGDTIAAIVDAVRVTLERCPPELSADLVDRGFVMAGGGALIRGIDRLLSDKTGLPVTVSDDPLSAVANGTGAVLNDLAWLMQHV
jgi:rod shape-determining protein MreB